MNRREQQEAHAQQERLENDATNVTIDPLMVRVYINDAGNIYQERLNQSDILYAITDGSRDNILTHERIDRINRLLIERDTNGDYHAEFGADGFNLTYRIRTTNHDRRDVIETCSSNLVARHRAEKMNLLLKDDRHDWAIVQRENIASVEAKSGCMVLYFHNGFRDQVVIDNCSQDRIENRAIRINWRIDMIGQMRSEIRLEHEIRIDAYDTWANW
jgi:hypothetical protein